MVNFLRNHILKSSMIKTTSFSIEVIKIFTKFDVFCDKIPDYRCLQDGILLIRNQRER